MGLLVSSVTQKLSDLLPNQIGDNMRWTSSDVERYIMIADRLIRERTECYYHSQEISLIADTLEYTLDNEFIDVIAVEFSSDGSTYDDYLKPATLDDLDKISVNWRDDGGTRPDYYTLLSAPGLASASILIYKPMTAVDSQTIRVTGHGMTTTTNTDTPDDILEKCHVPFVMAMLLLSEQPRVAASWYAQYLDGCDEIKRRFRSKLPHGSSDVRFGW